MKATKRLKLAAEFAGLKCLVLLLRLMPWGLAVKSGELLGLLISRFTPKRFKRTKRDIQKAFLEKSPAQVEEIARESFKNVGRMSAEFVKAAYLSKEALLKKIEFRNTEEALRYHNQGKGAIMHIGHFVNWEIIGLAAGYMLDKVAFVARPQSNKAVDEMLTKMRTSTGGTMINAYNPFFSSFKMIKKGYMIGILSDQSSLSEAALCMNFLGRPAEVAPMTAVLAIKMDIPVFPIRPTREGGKIIIEVQPPLYPPPGGYNDKNIYDFTRTLMDKYEEWIRLSPQDWLWGHNRWKREKQALAKMQAQAAATEPEK